MSGTDTLEATRPVFMFSRSINIGDYKKLFASLAKTVISASTLQWGEAVQSLVDTFEALGMESSPEELVWTLINRSMMQAIANLVYENRNLIETDSEEEFLNKADQLLEDHEMTVGDDFFANPKNMPIVAEMQKLLQKWLEGIGVGACHASAVAHRLPSFFVYELNNEWRNNENSYKRIREFFDTPFISASQREREWERYSAYLDRQINESIFAEAFGLAQIYIPLCGYYQKHERGRGDFAHNYEKQKIVIDLESHIERWLDKADKSDAIRVISGGPGSGKSSFAKILTAKLIAKRHVLFIPLHLIDLKKDLQEAIGSYLGLNGFFAENPYGREQNLIIVFDGLDELTQQGKACVEVAKQFIDEVQRHVNMQNMRELRLQVIITGRELVVQSNEPSFRKDGAVLYVLPYYITDDEKEDYIDKQKLLGEDKRDTWWRAYGALSGHAYEAMPSELRGEKLDEITSHPLLNYLVAMSFDRKKITFTDDTNLNVVYEDLISAVYERNYAGGIHRSIQGIKESEFFHVLEEIAISAWHGSGRTTTVKEIEEHCKQSGMSVLLEQFQEGAKAGVTNLLTAFYFRQSGSGQDGEKTFEFTHKSFGEYLMARRIVRQLFITADQLADKKKCNYKGWSNEDSLEHWIALCGKSALDKYSFPFLCDEMLLQDKCTVSEWQDMLCGLIGYMLRNGMPFERISPRPSFIEEARQSRNAEEALLAALSACARVTNRTSRIDWGSETAAGTWLSKLLEQRIGPYAFAFTCLNHLDLSGCTLDLRDLYGANLMGADLSEASLIYAALQGANLCGTNFCNANLQASNFQRANFQRADLQRADLKSSDLKRAKLQNANLQDVNLQDTNLRGADLQGANLQDADLRGAHLAEANFKGADMRGIDLRGTHLAEANFEGANFEGANFEGANLRGADLRNSIVNKKDLKGCKLDGALLPDNFETPSQRKFKNRAVKGD